MLWEKVHLSSGQPDQKDKNMSCLPDVVLLLVTRCLWWGVHLTKHQPDQQADHMLCWHAVIWLLTTRCMYWGGGIGLTGGVRGHWGLHMKNYNSVFQSTLEKSKQYIAYNRTRVQVNQTSVSTTLGHHMHLPWRGYIWQHITLTHRLITCHADLQ